MEDLFPYAIRFYFPAFYPKIDWSKGYVMLDKELRELFPESEKNERRADLLAKIWLLDGTEQWILAHIEVQGYKDPQFSKRMFTYYYRIADRFNVPVSALAILTDTNKNWHPDRYVATCMETELVYKYPLFKLIDYANEALDGDNNPWAIVMKAALIGLKGQWTDDALLEAKVQIYKELRTLGYSVEQVRNLLQFIKFHVRFRKKDFFHKFDSEIKKVENIKQRPMGIIELVKEHLIEEAKQEGLEKGIERGIEKGIEKGLKKAEAKQNLAGVRKMLLKGFGHATIMDVFDVDKTFIKEVQRQMALETKITELLAENPALNLDDLARKLKVSPLFVEILKEMAK